MSNYTSLLSSSSLPSAKSFGIKKNSVCYSLCIYPFDYDYCYHKNNLLDIFCFPCYYSHSISTVLHYPAPYCLFCIPNCCFPCNRYTSATISYFICMIPFLICCCYCCLCCGYLNDLKTIPELPYLNHEDEGRGTQFR